MKGTSSMAASQSAVWEGTEDNDPTGLVYVRSFQG